MSQLIQPPTSPITQGDQGFPSAERRGVYRAIHQRRDIRNFRSDPIPNSVLARPDSSCPPRTFRRVHAALGLHPNPGPGPPEAG